MKFEEFLKLLADCGPWYLDQGIRIRRRGDYDGRPEYEIDCPLTGACNDKTGSTLTSDQFLSAYRALGLGDDPISPTAVEIALAADRYVNRDSVRAIRARLLSACGLTEKE